MFVHIAIVAHASSAIVQNDHKVITMTVFDLVAILVILSTLTNYLD
jgi:hypothetical protein